VPDYLLLEEVARIARVPVGTVRTWIRSGRLPSVKPGRWRLVRRAALEALLTRDGHLERVAARTADGRFSNRGSGDG
jgi:excisionase family DNA binding protein